MRILVVDDEANLRDLLCLGLQHLGRCDTAAHGLLAAEMFKQACLEGEPYGLVTMDCQMPVLDGFGAVSMIRAFEATYAGGWFRTTICFISAEQHCRQRYEQKYGTDACLYALPKPFLFEDLKKISQLALARLRSAQPPVRIMPVGRVPIQSQQQVFPEYKNESLGL